MDHDPWPRQNEIDDYDPMWPEFCQREAARIRSVLGDRVARNEHTGSTFVPGLLFREWLRADKADREVYARTKRDLAARDWKYMQW